MQVIVELTWSCPAKCKHCPLRNFSHDEKMGLYDYFNVLSFFQKLAEKKKESLAVVLSGGEPSLLSNLYEYVMIAKKLGYVTTVVTNCFNPQNIYNAHPDVLEVSIDYFGIRHDYWRGINLWEKITDVVSNFDNTLAIRSTLFNDNLEDILKIKEWGMKVRKGDFIGVLVVPARGYPEKEPTKEQVAELKRIAEKEGGIFVENNCPAGKKSFTVTPKLEVLACFLYRKKLADLKNFDDSEAEKVIKEGLKVPPFACELAK